MGTSNDIPLPCLPPRAADAHKGDFGLALVVGGSPGMNGAVALFTAMGQGSMSPEAVAKLMGKFFDIPFDEAMGIVGRSGEVEVEEEAIRELKEAVDLMRIGNG